MTYTIRRKLVTDMVKETIVKPANRETNYFMKYGKFKNFDNLPNKRAKWFTLLLIKQQCKKHDIIEHDDLIKEKEDIERIANMPIDYKRPNS